jgi:hypothetical protein
MFGSLKPAAFALEGPAVALASAPSFSLPESTLSPPLSVIPGARSRCGFFLTAAPDWRYPACTSPERSRIWGSFPNCYFLPALLLSRLTRDWPAGVAVTPPPTISRALTDLS